MAAYTFTWKYPNQADVLVFSCLFVCLFINHIAGLKQLTPNDVMQLSNNACIVAVTEKADQDLANEFIELDDVSFADEPAVYVGTVSLSNFLWSAGGELRLTNSKNEEIHSDLFSEIDFVLFLRKKLDRTCLLQSQDKPFSPLYPVAVGYHHHVPVSINDVLEIINEKCETYKTLQGHPNLQGLHRDHILQNKFHVSDVTLTDNTIKDIYQDLLDKDGSCSMEGDISCVDNPDFGSTFPQNSKIPKCDRISLPTREDFFLNYLQISKPVIITGAMDTWSAMTKWTNDFLRKKFGERNIHIKLTPGGDYEGVEYSYLWDNYNTFHIPDKVREKLPYPDLVVVRPATSNMKFSDFLDLTESISHGKVKNISAYLEYSSISQYMPELKKDIKEMPFFDNLLKLQHLNFWLSDGNTLGRLHFDPFDNFLCQVSGAKEVILFEPHNNSQLYEGHIPEAMLSFHEKTGKFRRKSLVDSTSMVMSPVDILKPNFKRFPKFLDAYPLNCTISEGEVLFMPSFWWHEVQSHPSQTEARNLAVNFWYEPFFTKEFPCPECPLDINPIYRHLL